MRCSFFFYFERNQKNNDRVRFSHTKQIGTEEMLLLKNCRIRSKINKKVLNQYLGADDSPNLLGPPLHMSLACVVPGTAMKTLA